MLRPCPHQLHTAQKCVSVMFSYCIFGYSFTAFYFKMSIIFDGAPNMLCSFLICSTLGFSTNNGKGGWTTNFLKQSFMQECGGEAFGDMVWLCFSWRCRHRHKPKVFTTTFLHKRLLPKFSCPFLVVVCTKVPCTAYPLRFHPYIPAESDGLQITLFLSLTVVSTNNGGIRVNLQLNTQGIYMKNFGVNKIKWVNNQCKLFWKNL